MSSSIPDVAVQRDALLAGHRLDAGGLAQWAGNLVEAAALTVEFRAEVRVGTPPIEWSVEVRAAGGPVVLVDVADAVDHASLDRLELRAAHVWSDVTRGAELFEPRPWVGTMRVVEDGVIDAVSVERVRQLVASRTLDAACVVALDRTAGTLRSPSPVMSIESFQSALLGRFLVLRTLQPPA